MPLVFEHPELPPALNGNTRLHWAEKAKQARQAKRDFSLSIDWQKPLPRYWVDGLSVAVLFSVPHKRRIDLDNLFAGTKFWLDVLVDMKFIPDDNIKVVSEIAIGWERSQYPKTTITIFSPEEAIE